MNSKEAIKMLRTIKRTFFLGNQKFDEAIDVAIKALEQRPEITYCKDCIFGYLYFDVHNGVADSWVECRNSEGLFRDVSVDGYCYAGVRKGEPMRLIDADALKADYGMKDDCADCEKELRGKVKSCEYEHIYTKMDFCGWIDSMPTIEERKTGKWIIHETETDRYDDMKCPFCKKSYTVDAYRIDDIGFTAADFNFCPNCGADMRDDSE